MFHEAFCDTVSKEIKRTATHQERLVYRGRDAKKGDFKEYPYKKYVLYNRAMDNWTAQFEDLSDEERTQKYKYFLDRYLRPSLLRYNIDAEITQISPLEVEFISYTDQK